MLWTWRCKAWRGERERRGRIGGRDWLDWGQAGLPVLLHLSVALRPYNHHDHDQPTRDTVRSNSGTRNTQATAPHMARRTLPSVAHASTLHSTPPRPPVAMLQLLKLDGLTGG